MDKPLILVVEDDADMSDVICRYLTEYGYQSRWVEKGSQVQEHLADVALVILDLQLPEDDGLDILREIRRRCDVPVLIATARALGADRIVGLESGADDYLCKPFLPLEMIARVKALLRRSKKILNRTELGEPTALVLAETGRRAIFKGREVCLSPGQFSMLKVLISHPCRTFSQRNSSNLSGVRTSMVK